MRKFIAIILCAALLIPFFSAQAGEIPKLTNGDYEYALNEDGTAIITKYLGHETEVVVPASLDGIAVTIIGKDAFNGNSELIGITIPEGVRVIEAGAFDRCKQLTGITLPESLETLGDRAFRNCQSLKTFTVPAGLAGIGSGTFDYCTGLAEFAVSPENKSFHVFDGVLFDTRTNTLVCYPCARTGTDYAIPEGTEHITQNAFNYALNLTRVIIPASMTEIGEYAFYNAESLSAIEIPARVTKIGAYAFYGCKSLKEMNIPEGLTDIGTVAFVGCDSLTDIRVSPNNKDYASQNGILFDKAMTTMVACPGGMGDERMKIPEGVSVIGDGAFGHCNLLVHIEIRPGITTIGGFAFDGCSGLEQISLPDSVMNIDQSAFRYCNKLTDIRLPAVLREINFGLFERCENLKTIELPEGLTAIRQSAFQDCTNLKELVIPGSVAEIEYAAFKGCANLVTLSIPEGVYVIGEYAFGDCENLVLQVSEGSCAQQYAVENSIPYTLLTASPQSGMPAETQPSPEPATEMTPFPASDFEYTLNEDGTAVITRYLGSAVSLDIPGHLDGYPVSGLGAYSFSECASLEYAGIPDGVRSIGENAFTSCKNLKEIRIPDSVTGIGEWAFALNPNLSTVSIPGGIRNISKGMFHYCTALEDIVIPAGVAEIGESAFAGCSMKSVVIPDGVESIGSYAYSSCHALRDIFIPAGVSAIGPSAFSYSFNLSEITIADGNPMYEIVDGVLFDKVQNLLHAFPAGTNKREYEVPQGTKKIGDHAFASCTILQNITLPDSVQDIESGAFHNSGLTRIILPPNVTSIRQGLFAYCYNLESVSVPAGVTSIENDAFFSCDKLTLEVEEGSFAHQYAAENNIPFRLLSDLTATDIPETAPPSTEIPVETVTPSLEVPMETAEPMPEITPEALPEATPLPTEIPLAEETVRPNPWPTDAVTLYDLKAVNKGDERAMAWSGPGKNYRSAGAFKTNKLSRVKGIFIQGDYILVDMDYTGVGKRRVYFRKSAFKNTSAVPSGNMTGYGAVSAADALLYYGPGTEYDDFDGESLPGGTQISVFFEENGWLFAEFMTSEGLTRAWIESEAIQGAGM